MVDGESQPTEVKRERRERRSARIFMTFWMIGGGLILVFALKNFTLGGLVPVPWLGYVIFATGILAALGVNVFRGGPLDRRLDDDGPQPGGGT